MKKQFIKQATLSLLHNFSFLAITLLAMCLSLSCKKNDFLNSSETIPEIPNFKSEELAKKDTTFKQFGLSNLTYEQVLDSVGKWHNDYQSYLLQEIHDSKINLLDTISLKKIVKQKSQQFFKKKGIMFTDTNMIAFKLTQRAQIKFNYDTIKLSTHAVEILKDLQIIVNSIKTYNYNDFQKLSALKNRALSLKSNTEKISVGIPISVAMNSYNYWSFNGSAWMTKLKQNVPNTKTLKMAAPPAPPKIDLWQVGGADVVGAVSGAQGGAALGPGGALAVGILGASVGSLTDIVHQTIKHYVPQWPF